MPQTQRALTITSAEQRELERRTRSRKSRAEDAKRAKLILLLASGASYTGIIDKLDCSAPYISRWKKRFETDRLAGLYPRYAGRKPTALTPKMEARILAATRETPPDGSTQWSTRKLARHLGVSHTLVHRVWRRARLQPHRLERYMASNDPEFERKAADVIGLYLKPPQHAAVFCVDEKTAIQALDRKDPILPLSPGRAERHGFEYVRHGTLSLFAALDVTTGRVVGRTAARHTSAEFVAFLEHLVAQQPTGEEIHVIADNLSTHKTKRVRDFLDDHPTVTIHYTPTYSSWLNQIELWFSKITRDLLARGVFTSVDDLDQKILTYIRHYNRDASPFKWSYQDPSRRISTNDSANTVH